MHSGITRANRPQTMMQRAVSETVVVLPSRNPGYYFGRLPMNRLGIQLPSRLCLLRRKRELGS
jgi:hypothetical protein